MCIGLYVKYPLCLSDFNGTLSFLGRLWQDNEISNFIKILRVGAELFHADRRTGMKLVAGFRNFSNAPNELSATDFASFVKFL